MKAVAWVLFFFFGMFTLHGIGKFYSGHSLTKFHAVLWFLSAIVLALSIGVLFGGLKV